MLAISISINVIWVPLIVVLSALAGFIFRSERIIKLKKEVSSLEREMLNSHAEILTLQQEIVRAQNKQTNSKSLVVSMKDVQPTDESDERKKVK
jgi:hypothetical protein